MKKAITDYNPCPVGGVGIKENTLKPIALQLYSLREQVYPGGADLPGVLKTVAEIGYKGVEMAGLHGNDPKEIAKLVSDLGMKVCSSHAGVPTPENVAQIVDTESALGNKLVIGGIGPNDVKTLDQCKAVVERFQTAAELLKPHGMKFGIHNHWWEFDKIDGHYVYDILMNEADYFSELDVYWCAFGGANPPEIVQKYKDKIPLLHIKDGELVPGEHIHTAVGSGKVDMHPIIKAADPDVLQWCIVELDACKTDMLEAVKQSYRYLTSEGLCSGNK
jgi:sugar phosphate isomerase/epimerase